MIYEKINLPGGRDDAYIETYCYGGKCRKRDSILILPGGGYCCVATDWEGEPVAEDFLARGYNCFVLKYTVNPKNIKDASVNFPVSLIQAATAIKYIRENAEKYNITDRVFVLGFSAGGHLAASCATMWHIPEVQNAVGGCGELVKPTGAVLGYPVITAYEKAHIWSFVALNGGMPDENEKEKLSIEKHVDEKTCPCFLFHTAEDGTVPVENSLIMAAALSEAHIEFSLHVFPHGDHGLSLSKDYICKEGGNPPRDLGIWTSLADEWMRQVK